MSWNVPSLRDTVGTSGANATQTVSPATGKLRRVLWVIVRYSAAPTHAGVTVTLNSGQGAAFDTFISAGSANAQHSSYVPVGGLILGPNDTIDVTAPAGGAAITSSVHIKEEVLDNG